MSKTCRKEHFKGIRTIVKGKPRLELLQGKEEKGREGGIVVGRWSIDAVQEQHATHFGPVPAREGKYLTQGGADQKPQMPKKLACVAYPNKTAAGEGEAH
eukprot:406146-Pelagomonas_calceolata.AAC.4